MIVRVVIFLICFWNLANSEIQGKESILRSNRAVVGANFGNDEINHEWSFDGLSLPGSTVPPPPRVRNDGPDPKTYPPLIHGGTNTGTYKGQGGWFP
uniref:Uncharacterized protein n=1 Tax=Panagrolaimus sp. JU765 TaxID=591449 RepID=A0AC34QTD3_9BILA